MKKLIFAMLAVLIALSLAAPALAAPGNKVIKGEVTVIGATTFTVLTHKGETIEVTPPTGFDLTTLKIGDIVLVKGRLQPGGKLTAAWVKFPDAAEEDDDKNPPKDDKETSDYCTGQQTQPHPVASKLADKYGVTVDWIMGHFCNGVGMGQIMLALRTAKITGGDPEALLAQRAEGKGWGEIWKDAKLIGSEKSIHTPPGWLMKDKAKGKDKDKDK